MPIYIRLLTLTDDGIEALKRQAETVTAVATAVSELGGELLHSWICQNGRYDIVAIIEAPDDKTMRKIAAKTSSMRLYMGETMSAMPVSEFVETFGSNPQAAVWVESWFRQGRAGRGGRRR
jgi:uncharacterized protein with GYD domain